MQLTTVDERGMTTGRSPILILGAGINGTALARELLLNGLDVVLVDTADVAAGTTAYSSRLIHGGLRYLEYGEFALVRESLAERGRLLRLAPQFVRPLELFIPVSNRFGGLWHSALGFLRMRQSGEAPPARRGLWIVELGLSLYDAYARTHDLAKHRICSVSAGGVPAVDPQRYRWLAAYYDAQIKFPERFALALVEDCRQIARAAGHDFQLWTYHAAHLTESTAEIRPVGEQQSAPVAQFTPAVIVNATGAWVDQTLARLHVPAARLIGGTKGSHFVTAQRRLAELLDGRGIYAEADDGRPVFILPFGRNTLVGTTDLPFDADPRTAVAGADELDYLLSAVAEVFPQAHLSRSDIDLHYSGVRPLPFVGPSTPASITRRHALVRHADARLPMFSIVGGKLTTSRALAEETVAEVLSVLGRQATADSRERPVPGGQGYPASEAELAIAHAALARDLRLPLDSVAAVWQLCGTRSGPILRAVCADDTELLPGCDLPTGFVRWSIAHEQPTSLEDLVERRLMLLYDQRLSRACLVRLAQLLVEAGRLPAHQLETAVTRAIARLSEHFGKQGDTTERSAGA